MKGLLLSIVLTFNVIAAFPREHPSMMLTRKGVSEMRALRGSLPLFDSSVDEMLSEADSALRRPVCVPVPRDGGGGYTHEVHKRNYYDMNILGEAYQLTSDRRYAAKVLDILNAYCELYPTLGYHPLKLSPVPGRVFWQTLNESVWLLHTSLSYDCVRECFTANERRRIENKLLRPWAQFIMEGTEDNRANALTFNKMHNHATWAAAAVGMAGMAMDDDILVKKALYGSDLSGQHGGFLMQLDRLFSPDGYFTEGAYYHRYAIWPFVLFAACLDNYSPELQIFGYRDGILKKSLKQLLQQAYDGHFMYFNDALEKDYTAQELIYAIDIIYRADPSDKELLSIVRDYQKKVLPTDAGYAVARDIAAGETRTLVYSSRLLRDGKDGKAGGLAIIRSTDSDLNSALTMKATSHGLSHGHYDKLTIAYYDGGNEILTDYGAARFHNIESKHSGHYTRENKSYAMQTVAHNTVAVDCRSHYGSNYETSMKHSPRIVRFDTSDPGLQYVCAVDSTAYEGVRMQRWTALADLPFLQQPLVIDIFNLISSEGHCYDYPIHYNGHLISYSESYSRSTSLMTAFGEGNGYQHLWVEAASGAGEESTGFTWMTGHKMYSLTISTTSMDEVFFLRTGANDPDFNLRSEPALMIRSCSDNGRIFASCLESHGHYDVSLEQASNMERSCKAVRVVRNNGDIIELRYDFRNGCSVTVTAYPASGVMALTASQS